MSAMRLRVNSREHRWPEAAAEPNVLALMAELGFGGRKGMAVAVNGEVVGKATWADRRLADGDEVLVIKATQGG